MSGTRANAGRAVALVSFVTLLTGCAPQPPNFLLIVVDTLRVDHRVYAHLGDRSTPHLDELERESTAFINAYSTTSWTVPALASLFLSQLGSQHGMVAWGSALEDQHATLVEALRDAGYRTGGWSANVLMGRERGFQQGFEEYEVVLAPGAWAEQPPELFQNASAQAVAGQALRWLREQRVSDPDSPFFVYLHYMEPHTPYRCQEDAPSRCKKVAALLNQRLLDVQWEFTAEEQKMIAALYGREVVTLDAALGDLLGTLKAEGFLDDTWVFFTADHGEQLGESGHYLHGKSLDPQEIRVPLLVRGPSRKGSKVEVPVSLIDVAPTILDLAEVEVPPSFRGRSLRPALEQGSLASVPVVAELFPTTENPPRHRLVVIDGAQKIVMGPHGGLRRVDLLRDPGEQHSLPATRPELSQMLGDWEPEIVLSQDLPPGELELAPEMRESLRALGYIP